MKGPAQKRQKQEGHAPKIALLHTAEVHVATFETAFHQLRPDARLSHDIRPDLLERARREGLDAIRTEVHAALSALADADAVLCTCSTLGPLVDECAITHRNLVRIDRALMTNACRSGPRMLVALCLESTRTATLDLLHECAAQAGAIIDPSVVMCADAWTWFQTGDLAAYAGEIAGEIRSAISNQGPFDCVVLGQASMHVAAVGLADLPVPVLTSPEAAVEQCLAVADTIIRSLWTSGT